MEIPQNDNFYCPAWGDLQKEKVGNSIIYSRGIVRTDGLEATNFLQKSAARDQCKAIRLGYACSITEQVYTAIITDRDLAGLLKVLFLLENRRHRISKDTQRLINDKTIEKYCAYNCHAFALLVSLFSIAGKEMRKLSTKELREMIGFLLIKYHRFFSEFFPKPADLVGLLSEVDKRLGRENKMGVMYIRDRQDKKQVHSAVIIRTEDRENFLLLEKINEGWAPFRIIELADEMKRR